MNTIKKNVIPGRLIVESGNQGLAPGKGFELGRLLGRWPCCSFCLLEVFL